MSLFRCLLLLALIVAASATFGKRWELSKRGRCGIFCGLTKKQYVRPSRSSGRCLGVFGFIAAGVSDKLSIVKDIFGAHAGIGVAADIDVAVSTCLNLSRGIALIINQSVEGLGTLFENLIIGISRLIFCVLGNPWENGSFISRLLTYKFSKAPAICGKQFGRKWGWKSYLRGYSSWEEIDEYYNLRDIRIKIRTLIRRKFPRGGLKGTLKLIVDTMYKLCGLYERDFDSWQRDDYVDVTRYLVTISAAVASGYRVGTGVTVVDEYSEYLSPCYKKEFNVDITVETTVIKEELEACDTETFNGALKTDADINVNVNVNDESDDNASGNGGRKVKGTRTTTVKKTEYDIVYDEDGNIVSETKRDVDDE